ncbi:MAG TPA: hypothetical protein VEY91_02945 [Candidatus Limnocylindria bacterium]|nr:hypothetical protein [Candidatus Limnocylindria bacterium]
MKSKLGMAVTLGLLATGAFASSAHAQCGQTGAPMIEFDTNTFAYETNYNPATFNSVIGSQLTVVGKITLFCQPFQDLDAQDPSKEYTLVFAGLVSNGTVTTPYFVTGTKYVTSYSGGSFIIYEDTTPDAPTLATLAPNPPNAQVPARFADGTVILSGTLSNFVTTVRELPGGPPNQYTHEFDADFQFTGPPAGTYFVRVQGTGLGNLFGTWCPNGSGNGLCILPAGYSAQPNGEFGNPPTAVQSSTWGTIKQLYR